MLYVAFCIVLCVNRQLAKFYMAFLLIWFVRLSCVGFCEDYVGIFNVD